MQTKIISQSLMLASLALLPSFAYAQTWTTLTNRPPAGVTNCQLVTDGTVICQAGRAWYKLTPTNTGSYAAGTWTTLASLPSGYNPDAYASSVLADGRFIIMGGEYNNGSFALTNMGAIYAPVANTWATVAPPASTGSPNHWACIGDAPATVISDGRFVVGSKLYQDLAALDPTTLTWTPLPYTGKHDGFNSEEGWVLLPDGSIFTLDVQAAPASERYVLGTGWVSAGNTATDLHTPTTSSPLTAPGCPTYYPPGEIGPTILMSNGNVFAVGANGATGIYNPATNTWSVGPSLPAGQNVEDGPGVVLPSGHVLFGSSPGESGTGLKYYEFDGVSALASITPPGRASSDATYYTSLLVLPNGQVLFVDGSTTVQVYTSANQTYNTAWAPLIEGTSSTSLSGGTTYQISGTQFNGMTQANFFGDESQDATNYPLVRITNNATGHVFYCRTHGHTSMGVATGTLTVTTNFDVPANIESGPSTIVVVANGIPSAGEAVTVAGPVAPTITGIAPSSGPSTGGTSVVISGANFAAGATVTFGGTAGTVTANTGTSITVKTPAHAAGAVTVVVTNPGGTTASVTNGFTYTAPAPTIRSVSPTSGTHLGGTTVTIAGTNFVSGATVTFGGTSATVRSISGTSISVRTPAHATGAVSVVVTNPSGQSATLTNGYTYR